MAKAGALIAGFPAELTLADKGYAGDPLCDAITAQGSEVVIPPRPQPSSLL